MDLLEIRLNVGSWLDIHDLASSMRVSRLWHETFIPFLYRKCSPDGRRKKVSNLLKHHRHIRDLTVQPFFTTLECETVLQGCQLLQRLQVPLYNKQDYLDFISKLVVQTDNHRHLIRLDLQGASFTHPPQLLPVTLLQSMAVQGFPHLTDLRLVSIPLEGELLQGFLKLAPQLTRLELNNCRAKYDRSETWSQWPTDAFTALRDLIVLDEPTFKPCGDMLRLFENCPKLESFSWKLQVRRSVKSFVKTLCAMLRGDSKNSEEGVQGFGGARSCCWPRLDSIRIVECYVYYRSSLKDELVAQLLDCCPRGLCRLTLPKAHFGIESWKALKRGGHLNTLRNLNITTESWMIQEILASCPELREFQGGTLLASELVERIDGGADDDDFLIADDLSTLARTRSLPPRPWLCRNLQVLKIMLRRSTESDASVDRAVFEQLKKVTTLRELYLCEPSSDRTKYGLDPRVPLGVKDLADFKNHTFAGIYRNIRRLRTEPMSPRVLENWPVLDHCCWHPLVENSCQ